MLRKRSQGLQADNLRCSCRSRRMRVWFESRLVIRSAGKHSLCSTTVAIAVSDPAASGRYEPGVALLRGVRMYPLGIRLMRRAALFFVAAASCGLTLPAASARAADPVIVSDHLQGGLTALGGNLVYPLKKTKGKFYVCMRRVGGKLLRAHLPRGGCGAGTLGLDRRGRVVYLFPLYLSEGVPMRWYAYGVKSDRTR